MCRKILLLGGLIIVFLFTPLKNDTGATLQYVNWTVPKRIPGVTAFSEAPYLIADSNGNVHAFHSQYVDGKVSIVYSKWDYEHGWTLPVDILLPSSGEALIKGTFLDKNGLVHLMYTVGDQYGGEIYYTNAHLLEAGDASAWSTPTVVGKKANMFAADMAGDNKGSLYIVYGGTLDGNGLYKVHSQDNGVTWSEPESIFLTNKDELLPGAVNLLMDDNSELHIAWSNWRPPLGALELYYSRLDVSSEQITDPVRLSGGGADSPIMIKNNGALFLIYATGNIANGVAGKAMQQSFDGGRNWTNPTWAFPPVVGGNGPATLVTDSNGNLHAFLGNRAGDCCHGMWYSAWEGNRWSKPQAIIQGPKNPEFDPYSPRAVISQGNIALVTWWNESHNNGIWYSYAKLDAPALPLVALPTTLPSPEPTTVVASSSTVPTIDSLPTQSPNAVFSSNSPSVSSQMNDRTVLIMTIIPLFILITVIILWRTRR